MRVTSTEVMVFNYPDDMNGWKLFRFEYGFESGVECTMWFPPNTTINDIEKIEDLLNNVPTS